MRRVVVLGRGGAGKSTFARRLAGRTGLPVIELDTLFWQPGLVATDPATWASDQSRLVQDEAWIMDGDLGPYDDALPIRLRSAETIVILDFTFLPKLMEAITREAPHAEVTVLRGPATVRRFMAAVPPLSR